MKFINLPILIYFSAGVASLSFAETLNLDKSGNRSMDYIREVKSLPEQHNVMPSAVAFSSDEKFLAVRTADNKINIWDWRKGTVHKVLVLPPGANDSGATEPLKFDPKGRYLASCHSKAEDDTVITIWSAEDWSISAKIKDQTPGSGCNAIAFSPTGNQLIRILNRPPNQSGDTLLVYGTDKWGVLFGKNFGLLAPKLLSMSPDGNYIALAGTEFYRTNGEMKNGAANVSIFDIKERSKIEILKSDTFELIKSIVSSIPVTSFSQLQWIDNTELTHAGGHGMESFNAMSGIRTFYLQPTTEVSAGSIRYTNGGKYMIESQRGTVSELRICDAKHHTVYKTIKGEFGSIDIAKTQSHFATAMRGKAVIYEIN